MAMLLTAVLSQFLFDVKATIQVLRFPHFFGIYHLVIWSCASCQDVANQKVAHGLTNITIPVGPGIIMQWYYKITIIISGFSIVPIPDNTI
jgi:hypothetical protein